MGSRRRKTLSKSTLGVGSEILNCSGSDLFRDNHDKVLSIRRRNMDQKRINDDGVIEGAMEGFNGRNRTLDHANCTSSTRSHNTRNYFSLASEVLPDNNKSIQTEPDLFDEIANGLISILILLLCGSMCIVHGGFPGRGPPTPPRGPPLLQQHPLAGLNPFNRRRPPPPHHGPPHSRGRHAHPPPRHHHNNGGSDLSVAAQTLYDLRGYQFSGGPENPRYHRQNDPFTLPTPLAPNPRTSSSNNNQGHSRVSGQDTRTAPLVFPSFYQEQPTPTPTRSTIFGHNQHLSQTRFEPPAGFHLGGNSASGKITLEQQSASSRDQFRPSQIDISLHSNQVTPSPAPSHPFGSQSTTLAPETNLLTSTSRPRPTVKLSKSRQHDPFVYVYDEVDYDEGDDDFTLGGRHRTPQNQINSNRITPSTSTTTVAPLRGREPTIVPQFPPLQYHQPQQQSPLHHQPLFTSTTAKPSTTTQNSLFYSQQKDEFRDPFRDPTGTGLIRPPVTPRPNVEIVPSSERKPPPDQSNAIAPALARFPPNTIRDFGRAPQHSQIPLVSDVAADLRRRPGTTTTTTLAPPTNSLIPQYQFPIHQQQFPQQPQQSYLHHQQPQHQPQIQQYQQPQGRQVNNPVQQPQPYFPPGLDRRPFEAVNEIPSVQTKNQFNQVVNLLQEEEDEYNHHNNNNPNNAVNHEQSIIEQNFQNPSKLRPVNTIIPKNRIPKEDFVLPPNFPFTHAQDGLLTTPLSPLAAGNRGTSAQQRLRDQTTRIREELPRNPTTSTPDDNLVNQHHSQVTPTPSRGRGRQQQPQRQASTTPQPSAETVPQRTRGGSARQRLRPNYRQTTTTTTTTTTPAPTYVEYPSQEYIDDYDNSQPQQHQTYQQSPPPAAPQQEKPISRFPPFPGKKVQQEVSTVAPVQLQRQRPTLAAAGRQRPGKGHRFRESTTPDTTSPRTTGKPLYTTGKMLSKEGGLYAGQMITSSHVYGHPVPNMPINSVLDKMPGVLDGNSVILATTKPSFGSPQKHLRSKQRFSEHGPPSRINHSGHRLRPNARPAQEGALEIVETVTLRPYNGEDKSKEEPKRLRAGNQFVRGSGSSSQQLSSTERSQEEGQHVLPRRRKRPGHRRQQQQNQNIFTETASVRPEEDDISTFQTERAQILRDHSPAIESTTANSVIPASPRSRRPRPLRPGKFSQQTNSDVLSTSEKSREDSQSLQIEEKPAKPIRKLRPRLRPVPVGQLNPQQQRGASSEVITQSQSAQVDRKPTDAPGRFSSRFRDQDNFDSSTVSTLRGDERESSSTSPGRFSPPTSRPTFKPPPPKKPLPGQRNGKRGPNSSTEPSDELPESIKLSPKDVIANRKPARRIPPGSASDRLKALQQRRNKVFGQHQGEEQTAEGRQVPVTKRPRLKPVPLKQQQQNQEFDEEEEEEEEEHQLPQPQRLRRPNQSGNTSGSKREVFPRAQQNKLKENTKLDDYYNEEVPEHDKLREDFEDENDEYSNDEQVSLAPQPQFTQNLGRPGRNNGGFQRNRSVEVTSDEARSVLGIPRLPAAPRGSAKKIRFQKKYQYEDEEEEEDDEPEEEEPAVQQRQHQQQHQLPEQKREQDEVVEQRPILKSNPPRLKLRQSSKERQRFQTVDEEREFVTVLPQRHDSIGGKSRQQVSKERQRASQERLKQKQRQVEEEDQEEDQDDYKEDTADDDDREEPQRNPILKLKKQQQQQRLSSKEISSSSFQKAFRNKKFNSAEQIGSRQQNGNARRHQPLQRHEEGDEEEIENHPADEEEVIPPSERSTSSTTSSSTSSSTSTSTSTAASTTSTSSSSSSPIENDEEQENEPATLPPTKGQGLKPQSMLGMLKARLRQNRRRLIGQKNGGKQQRISVLATTTQATITEESQINSQSPRQSKSKPKHGTIHVHKVTRTRPRHHNNNSGRNNEGREERRHGGGGGKRNSKKFIAMATENPSLPLESIFPEVP